MKNLSHLSVLCFGEVLFDQLPAGYQPGGAPLNVAVHLANLGIKVGIVSKIGNDTLGNQIRSFLKERKVNSNMLQVEDIFTTDVVKVKFPSPDHPIYVLEKDAAWDHIEHVYENHTLNPSYIIHGSLSCRYLDNQITLNKLIKKTQSKVVFDLNLRTPYYKKKIIEELLKSAHVIKMNKEEFQLLLQWFSHKGQTKEKQLLDLKANFPLAEIIILTEGTDGAMVAIQNEIIDIPCFKVKQVQDTVGCGDAFLAAFLGCYMNEKKIIEALQFAAATSAFVATQIGANPKYNETDIINAMNKVK